jgi:hypothetical protein
MAKILCVLYPDPETGYPPHYARDTIPTIAGYANGQTAPTPKDLWASDPAHWWGRCRESLASDPIWRSSDTN